MVFPSARLQLVSIRTLRVLTVEIFGCIEIGGTFTYAYIYIYGKSNRGFHYSLKCLACDINIEPSSVFRISKLPYALERTHCMREIKWIRVINYFHDSSIRGNPKGRNN